MTLRLVILFVASSVSVVYAQDPVSRIIRSLAGPNGTSIYNQLVTNNEVPFTAGDSAVLLYQGKAENVGWMGDFNGWGSDKDFASQGSRIPGTDIWYLKCSFPPTARLDYKIVVDNKWIRDPVNPYMQFSGTGGEPNSELRMPLFRPDRWSIANPAVPKGNLQPPRIVTSKHLGYDIAYSVYVPYFKSGSPKKRKMLPVLYVLDGNEYADPKLGSMVTILDNLIHHKKLEPVLVVFVDQRNPYHPDLNRRMTELTPNEKYASFLVDELLPDVEHLYHIDSLRRGVLGTSLGGLTASSLVFTHPDVFRYGGIQSPAYWYWPEIFIQAKKLTSSESRLFITTGTVHDTKSEVEKMKTILAENACTFESKEVAQGHSWGNWKDLLDDILIYFFPPK